MSKLPAALRMLTLMAAAVLLAFGAPVATAGHRCVFDELQSSQLATGFSVVGEAKYDEEPLQYDSLVSDT